MASAGGLFWDGLYRDNTLVTAAFRGNDLITLVIAVPGLVIALLIARRGSNRARLIWMGLLAYMLYNYVFYLYGTAFNRFPHRTMNRAKDEGGRMKDEAAHPSDSSLILGLAYLFFPVERFLS